MAASIRRLAPLALVPLALAGCSSTPGGGEGGGGMLRNFLLGGAGPPPVQQASALGPGECPAVTIAEGGAAVRTGEGATVRSQLSIAEVARECIAREDGAVLVKVGVQGRALIGPGGSAARFDTPLTIVIKRGDQVLASRVRRVAVAIQPGQLDGSFVVVEEGLVVPPGAGEFDIEVALGGGARTAEPGRRRRRG